jgi:uncharacterized SAM-dependent methyltransferase
LAATFSLKTGSTTPFFNTAQSRIEMHLRALKDIQITLPGHKGQDHVISFGAGDLIHTENSYKYSQENFAEKLRRAGFKDIHCWTNPNKHFLVCFAKA